MLRRCASARPSSSAATSPQDLGPDALSKIFGRTRPSCRPYAGAESNNGYVIYRVTRVVDVQPDETRARSVQSELGRANGTQEFKSFLDGLRADSEGGDQQGGAGKEAAVGKLLGRSESGQGAHHRIESAVHVGDLAGHPGRQVGQQKRRYVAHVPRRHVFAASENSPRRT